LQTGKVIAASAKKITTKAKEFAEIALKDIDLN
jgi:hypothetical protein